MTPSASSWLPEAREDDLSDDAMVIDGRTVYFVTEETANGEDGFRVLGGDHQLLGTLSFGRDRSELVARTSNGEPLMEASPWGGALRARFATRDLAVRALLARQ